MSLKFRKTSLCLTAALLAFPLASGPAAAFEIKDKAALDKLIHDYIVSHPEVLLEAQDALQRKQEVAKRSQDKTVIAKNKDAIFNDTNDAVLGNPEGKVTVVEFFDYNCPYCKHAIDDMKALLETDKDVRYVLKEFPILGPDSIAATHVSLAFRAVAPKKYPEFFETLLGSKEHANADRAFAVAAKLGVDADALKAKMKDPGIEKEVQKAYDLANDLGVTGTPAYVIGDEALSGAIGAQALAQKVENVKQCGSTAC